jgi:UDP-N-acetylmuramoyl-tripeptide--D-alanyl-D-alanine ligase
VDTLLLAIAIADEFGLTDDQIVSGVAATKPVEHRMNPYMLNGAWIIDDTYNGNIEGMKAGLRVLQLVDGTRKIYVTPGLVDQGDKISEVHHELAQAITEANPDIVVVMVHKDTSSILEGLAQSGYKGHIIQEKNPLRFYQNIEHFIVAGDVVMLQNDLPDAYR